MTWSGIVSVQCAVLQLCTQPLQTDG